MRQRRDIEPPSPEHSSEVLWLANKNWVKVGGDLYLEIKIVDRKRKIFFYRNSCLIRIVKMYDRVDTKIFMTEAVELGAQKTALAKALKISRTTLDQNIKIKKYYGIEGLIQGYDSSGRINRREQKKIHNSKCISGNRTEQIKLMEEKGDVKTKNNLFNFSCGTAKIKKIADNEQIFFDKHDWQKTRYAGVFLYLPVLIHKWRWMELVIGHFGSHYKIFMAFLLMVAKNIKSIEQLKNVRLKEAGIILGIGKLPSRSGVWEWFYNASNKNAATNILTDYFKFQIQNHAA